MGRFQRWRVAAGLAPRAARALLLTRTSRAHPPVDGRLTVRGADAPIEVLRDRFGVPHIDASSDRDACFGQGFVHAQDRLFQVELMCRLAAGRLAELFGREGLESDRFMRRLGLADRAGRDLERCGEEERELLAGYAAGFNAAVHSYRTLPPEFALLDLVPEPWHPEHSLLLGRMVMFSFATNWDTELLRERLLRAIGPEAAALADGAYPADGITHIPTEDGPDEAGAAGGHARLLAAYHAALAAGLPAGGGSNAWAIAGHHTASGVPLLASDPHLQARLPGLFHVAHLHGGGWDTVGATIPGLPGVVIGHNGRLAWGLTAGLADTADCYVETVDPDDPTRYRTPAGWETGRTRIERIAVRGGNTVEERVLETRHGPVIGPALRGEDRAVALRATSLEPGETIGPLLDLGRARTVAQLEEAIARWPGATFNFVFAAYDGHGPGQIGYRMGGGVPARAHGEGLLPVDGAISPGPPQPWPADRLPRALDPPSGLVISANQAPGGDLELGEEWCEPWRAERIAELLAAQARHTIADQQAIQCDLHSEPLRRLRDLLLAAEAVDDPSLRAALSAWDGQVAAGSVAAGALESVYQELARAVAARIAGPEADTVLGAGPGGAGGGASSGSSFHYRLQGRVLQLIEQPGNPACADAADRDRLLRAATARALLTLRRERGSDPTGWRWGALHRISLVHPLAAAPLVGRRFSRGALSAGGDVNTVWQGGYSVHAGPAATGFVPAYRQVIDLHTPDRSVFQLPAGNSGIPGHPRYDDCIAEFMAGRYRPLLYTRAAIEQNAQHRLVLVPQ